MIAPARITVLGKAWKNIFFPFYTMYSLESLHSCRFGILCKRFTVLTLSFTFSWKNYQSDESIFPLEQQINKVRDGTWFGVAAISKNSIRITISWKESNLFPLF